MRPIALGDPCSTLGSAKASLIGREHQLLTVGMGALTHTDPVLPAGHHTDLRGQINLCSNAYPAAAVRDETSIFTKMLLRCRATVFSLR